MGTAYLIVSAVLFLLEIILQLCVVVTHSGVSQVLFLVLLTLVMGPIIFINFVSAIQVTRTQDFTGKACGRAICIGLHSFQLGVIWRALKLLILFDNKDWLDYLKMRLFHCAFQSLPFSIVLSYNMFVTESKSVLDIMTIVCSVLSASVAFSTHRSGDKLYASSDQLEDKPTFRLAVCVTLLTFSSLLVLLSRCASIVLFTLAQPYWIPLPLGLHFVLHIVIETCKLSCSDDAMCSKVANAIYVSFVNIYDMVGQGYEGVKCVYVLYYTVMLIENLTFSFYWMLTAQYGEQFKLLVVLMVLLCFIIGLIVKFASCGYIFNVESDILSDAFNNPELNSIKDKHKEPKLNNADPRSDIEDVHDATLHHHYDNEIVHNNAITLTVDNDTVPSTAADRRSNHGSMSPASQLANRHRKQFHDNPAFVQSQGNISRGSNMTHNSNTRSQGSNKHSKNSEDVSNDSLGSKNKQLTPRGKENSTHGKVKNRDIQIDTHQNSFAKSDRNRSQVRGQSPEIQEIRTAVKPTIIVSDTSRHSLPRDASRHNEHAVVQASNGNLTLASSHSKYSRNTHTMTGTLNGSVQNYGYNGFDDPFRERRQIRKPKSRTNNHRRHRHGQYRHPQNLDYSLDSSELYPSITSDSSSVSTYTETNERLRRKSRQRMNQRKRPTESYDGYSTDVSNSDYLSFNDYSMEDSSSWTESSESSSDGAATWPPSQPGNLLKMYNIPDRESSTENILHWLDSMDPNHSHHDASFSTLHEPSVASDTDISLTAMQTFEVKKEKKRFKRLISKPKGLLLKFSSLNYKGKEKSRPYPLKKITGANDSGYDNGVGYIHSTEHVTNQLQDHVTTQLPTMPLPVDSVQESIV